MPKITIKNESEHRPFSFYERTKERLVQQISVIKQKNQLNSIVLVLDITSARIISKLFTITELISHGIMFVERLEVVRKQLEHHAIYFITPTQQSIEAMLKDFQSQEKPQYRKVHVLFTDALDLRLMKQISACKGFLKKLVKNSFKQFYCQLQIVSDNCVHMGLDYLSSAYSRQNNNQKQMRMKIGRHFVHLLAGYPKLFTARILYPKNIANQIARRISQQASKQIHSYFDRLLESKSHAIDPHSEDITILVLDRSMDVITPLMHGYSYEALLYDDVLNQGQKGFEEYEKLPLDVFNQFRYRHISHALTQLPQRLNRVAQRIKKQEIQALDVKELVQQKQKIGTHIALIMRLWEKYQQKQLREVGQVQLSLATGVTEEGKQTSSSTLINQVIEMVKMSKNLTRKQKIRLGMLVLACIKLNKQDYQKMLSLFPEDQKKIFINFIALGVTYDKNISRSTKNIQRHAMDRAKMLLEQRSIPSQRFSSALQITLPLLIAMLREDKYGKDCKKMQELVVSIGSQQGLLPKFSTQKLICFMCGGLSQTQICSIRRNPDLDGILLAADKIITPGDFVSNIREIDIFEK